MNPNIAQLEDKIRDRINARRKQHELIGRRADWHRLCSALDVVGDIELGLDAYLIHGLVHESGVQYLHIYGALQLLQTQQDAVAEICAALQIKPRASPKIPLVRELRSSSVGHPMRQLENNQSKSNFIVRATMSQHEFTLLTVVSDDWASRERQVSVPRLIELQRQALAATLSEVIDTLDEAEMKHREQHKSEKLTNCFPETLSYYYSKITEAIHSPRTYPLGKMHVELVRECLSRMRTMLEERGEWGNYDSIDYEYELLLYPLDELSVFFTDRASSRHNEKDANIFCAFVREQMNGLVVIAREIDEKYEQAPPNDN